ncbi:MAG TPA: ATP-binding protein, partial [Polyangium sp.]|nr:ATP-binding protein [Polyangium sp.]
MWLENVTLTNLFCYHEEVTFDFGVPVRTGGPRNIAIVWGRNGYGKTSFLTGMKLLVGGTYEKLRASVFRGRTLSIPQYLLGLNDEWTGIVNTVAWRKARTDVRVAIGATWHGPKNGRIRVEREWQISKKTQEYQEKLTITDVDGRIWEGEDATNYLNTIFPVDYIDFVMYDGEQIQELADSSE